MESMPADTQMINLHATIRIGDIENEVWRGYGSNFTIYLLRNFVIDKQLYRVLSPLSLLRMVTSSFLSLPLDYFGGVDYYYKVLLFLRDKLKSANLKAMNSNSDNIFLSDFMVTLHQLDHHSTRDSSKLITDLYILLMNLMDKQSRYITMIKCLDLIADPKIFCQAKGYSIGLLTVYKDEVERALQTDTM